MNIAAYCRVSTDKEDQLNSLETQKNFFAEYATKNGHYLVQVYADEGISGTKTKNRKAFLQLMEDASMHSFEMLVVKDISRFARNTVDLLQNVRTLKSLGIETLFLTANMTVLGQSEFVLTVFGALAQEESANISKRVKFGKKENARKGRVPNFVYGYNKTKGDYFNLSVNEREAEIVRQIYHWYLKDGYGAARIANLLNERGERTKRGCQFSQNAICRILTNEIYTGKIVNGKEEVVDFLTGMRQSKASGEWMVMDKPELRIISDQEFAQVAGIMEARRAAFHVKHERQSNRYLFSTLIKCKDCGWSFRRVVRRYKNTYIKWVCSGHNGRGADSCPNAIVLDEEELVQQIDAYLQGIIQQENQLEKTIQKAFLKKYKSGNNNEKYREELEAKLQKQQRTRQKYMDMYADDLISREELKEAIGHLKGGIAAMENELQLLHQKLDSGSALDVFIQKNLSEIKTIISIRNMNNMQLKKIIERIEVDQEGHVDIYMRELPGTVPFTHNRTQRPYGETPGD